MLKPRRDLYPLVALFGVLLGMAWVIALTGCTPAEQGGADGVRTVQLGAGDLVGQIEWDDGTVVDLATGLTLSGDETRKAKRIDVSIGAEVLINGEPQAGSLVYHSERQPDVDTWMRCLSGKFSVMSMVVSGAFPLSPGCEPVDVTVSYKQPFRGQPGDARTEQPSPDRADR